MKRLRELSESDPALERAQALLSAVEPVDDSQARMLRVRRGLERRAQAALPARRRRAFALALALVFAGSALAAAQSLGVIRAIFAPAARVETSEAAARPTRKWPLRAAPLLPPVLSAPERPPEPVPAPVPASAAEPDVRPVRQVQVKTAESELVRRALMALRRDHDPRRAARLLGLAHARDPSGPLAEEVMSLRVEAAVASHDARARSYAQQYLARYPDGRYRALAEKTLAAP